MHTFEELIVSELKVKYESLFDTASINLGI